MPPAACSIVTYDLYHKGNPLGPMVMGACRALVYCGAAAALGAAIPVLVSTIHAVRAGWEPAGDDGIIVTRAWDVLTAHSPLVGQYSEAGTLTGHFVHSPGPLLYWLLALPARFGSTASIAVTMGAVNTLAIELWPVDLVIRGSTGPAPA